MYTCLHQPQRKQPWDGLRLGICGTCFWAEGSRPRPEVTTDDNSSILWYILHSVNTNTIHYIWYIIQSVMGYCFLGAVCRPCPEHLPACRDHNDGETFKDLAESKNLRSSNVPDRCRFRIRAPGSQKALSPNLPLSMCLQCM